MPQRSIHILLLPLSRERKINLHCVAEFTTNGDNLNDFELNGNHHSVVFDAISVDGGITWISPENTTIYTYGSIAPYDNSLIDETTGYFGIHFNSDLETGTILQIRYVPKANQYKINTTLHQPASPDRSFVDYRKNVRLLDHAVELI